MAEWKEDLERAFNIMNEELLRAEYKARVDYYWKSMDEIMEEVAPHTEVYKKLEEENKKLNIKVASLEWEIQWLNSVIDKLKEENQTLELWLDNKEKLNEEYRKQIDKLRTDNIYEEWLYD